MWEQFTWVSAVLMAVVEKFCEFVLQGLFLVGVKDIKPEAKAILIQIFTVILCFAFSLDVFPILGIQLAFWWLGPLFTGLLVGTGADILHVAKERILKPKVNV